MSETMHRQRKLKYGVSSAVAVIIFAGILIALNIIGQRLFLRADLTEWKEFTVSQSTRNILRDLDDLISIQVFFSKDLPPQVATLEQRVSDILREYEVYSGGRVSVRYLDPEKPEVRHQAAGMGIPQLQMNVLQADQFQIMNVYMGIGIRYGERMQAIPMVQDVNTLEYDLTSAIIKLTRDEEKTVGFLTGHGQRDLDQDYTFIRQRLEDQYRLRTVNLYEGLTAVPDDINTLIIPGGRDIPGRVRYEIDQFVMRGGRLIVFADVVQIDEQMGLRAHPSDSGLSDLLAHYGVQVGGSLVLDGRSSMASFSTGMIAYTTPYPYWPRATGNGLDLHHPITSRLESVTFPWTAPLEVRVKPMHERNGDGEDAWPFFTGEPVQPDVRAAVLAASSEMAWTRAGNHDLNPQSPAMRAGQPTGISYPLAVALQGHFTSFYEERPVPARPAPEGMDADGSFDGSLDAPPLTRSALSQVLVVGCSRIVENMFLRLFPENMLFFENAVDWMTLGEDLIAIRSRGATDRPLRDLSDGARTAIRISLTFGPAVLVIAFGLIRGGVRRRNRQKLADQYA